MYGVFPPDFLLMEVVTSPGWLDDQLTQLHDGGAFDVSHPDIVPDYAPDLHQFLLHPFPIVSISHVGAVALSQAARIVSIPTSGCEDKLPALPAGPEERYPLTD